MDKDMAEKINHGLVRTLDIDFTVAGPERVEAIMPITSGIMQPFGFVHGGATLSLLESVASRGAMERSDLDVEVPFGVEVSVRHRKSGVSGAVRGVATFDHEEPGKSAKGGVRQYWNVVAYDDVDDVMSSGVVMMRVIPKERL